MAGSVAKVSKGTNRNMDAEPAKLGFTLAGSKCCMGDELPRNGPRSMWNLLLLLASGIEVDSKQQGHARQTQSAI